MTTTDVKRFAGFDLGHGETAVSIAGASGRISAASLTIGEGGVKVIPTAVASSTTSPSDADILVGRQAIVLPDLAIRYVAFKHPDLSRRDTRQGTELFVRGVVRRLIDQGSVDADVEWVVGHPSGWKRDVIDEYRNLLAGALGKRPRMLAEAQAAFLPMKAKSELTVRDLDGYILIIDMGSSTTDFAVIHGVKAIDVGNPGDVQLGAGLIDLALFQHALGELERKDKATHDTVVSYLEKHPSVAAQVLFTFREAKERYFNDETLIRRSGTPQSVHLDIVEHSLDVAWSPKITAELMDRILETPLPELGVTKDFFGSVTRIAGSWRDEFGKHITYALSHSIAPPTKVLITGGAAKMNWVLAAVGEQFPGVPVIRAVDPEVTIADGLALYGAATARIEGFLNAVTAYTRSGRIELLVDERYGQLAGSIADGYAAGAVERFILPAFLAWRNNELKALNDVEGHITQRMESWGANDGREELDGRVQDWFVEHIAPGVNADVRHLTEPFPEIPNHALELPLSAATLGKRSSAVSSGTADSVILDSFDNVAPIVSTVAGAIIGASLFGGGMAIVATTGPAAPIVAGVAAIAVFLVGADALKENLSSANLPPWVRRLMKSESGLRSKLASASSNVDSEIRSSVIASLDTATTRSALIEEISRELEFALVQRAEEASAYVLG